MNKIIKTIIVIVILTIISLLLTNFTSQEYFTPENKIEIISPLTLKEITLNNDEVFNLTLKNIVPENKKLILSTHIENKKYWLGYKKDVCDNNLYLLETKYPDYHYAFFLNKRDDKYSLTTDSYHRVFGMGTRVKIINPQCSEINKNSDVLPSSYEYKLLYVTENNITKLVLELENQYMSYDKSKFPYEITLNRNREESIKFDFYKFN